MNLEEAKDKVRLAIKDNTIYGSDYEINENEIIEIASAWYIPFVNNHPIKRPVVVGAYDGFIVGKALGDLHQPGSAFTIRKWLTGYELGLLDGPHDLLITEINDKEAARQCLRRLHLIFFKPEIENGTTWKIPRTFTDKMIDERLANLPATFKNQRFVFNIEEFEECKASKIFTYHLIKTTDAKATEIGEELK